MTVTFSGSYIVVDNK